MEPYPYEESLEWVPREYPINDNTNPAAKLSEGRQRDYTGHPDYPGYPGNLEYPTPSQPATRWQPSQRYPQYQQPQQYQQRRPQPAQQRSSVQATRLAKTGARMSKSEALNLLESLKKSILVAALIAFGVLSGLVATHVVGSAASGPSSPSPSVGPSQQNPNNSGGYFNQQGGGGGYQFGPGGSQPFSGSHTS